MMMKSDAKINTKKNFPIIKHDLSFILLTSLLENVVILILKALYLVLIDNILKTIKMSNALSSITY